MRVLFFTVFLYLMLVLTSCNSNEEQSIPNVIIIMADDMGYECLSCNGSQSYKTPNLDSLAEQGIRFTHCVSQPLSTPSRAKMMTGMYNYRNYDYFGHLGTENKTIGNLMQEGGYTTCISGKWQLNGLSYPDQISDWNDSSRPNQMGFDNYCLWQLTKTAKEGGRYSNPLIEQDGTVLERDIEAYGPDIFSSYILNFIEDNRDKPFFVYYPMVLVHDPFCHTPDSEDWDDRPKEGWFNDTTYFRDMVEYSDKIVGKIMDKLKEHHLTENTIVVFTGDNGTHPTIYTHCNNEIVRGGKGKTTDAGTRVPLIVHWPKNIQNGAVYDGLIEFSDFYSTLADLVGDQDGSDGHSFLPLLRGEDFSGRETAFVYYDPRWSKNVNYYRNVFIRTENYKLYKDGRFFDLKNDVLEEYPISTDSLNEDQQKVYTMLNDELKKHPDLKPDMK